MASNSIRGRTLKKWIVAVVVALAWAQARLDAKPVQPAGEVLVRDFVKAYNAHNIEAMLRFCAPDIRWMNIEGDSLSTETTADFKLDEAMRKYFKGTPSAHSELRSLIVNGPFVSTIEEATWERGGKKRQQCSIGVYEIRDTRIKNVWYFPAHDCAREQGGSPVRPGKASAPPQGSRR